MTSVVDVRRLGKTFPHAGKNRQVLRDIDLQVAQGEIVALLGPSGCGKSTLLRIIAGLEQHDSGELRLAPAVKIGMVFQSYSVFPWLSVEDNVAFGLTLQGATKKAARQTARELLEKVGLAGQAKAWTSVLSGGMKQRLAIARALAVRPELLLMDEPFGALDAFTRFEMQQLLLRLWQESGKTVVFVTHDIDEAILLADRIVVLSPNPGSVNSIIPVDLPRPRHDLTDPTLLQRQAALRSHLYQLFFSMQRPVGASH
ncbi:ABC transporter ATP-binding protein [Erwinia sp. S38]|uniref:ABC transporter ATP-binding protein n=1 Tax=Erwinia sp. S38 TaxID=2769338 RepID=UPI00190B85A2|nr:ABC transporter ATP-binding protein [Erwinia sp. S38]MBK0003565.1 ABC transporter ATP-binding protein [Erwinia sp. S38]